MPPLPLLDRRARTWLIAIIGVGAVLRILWATQAQQPQELRDPALYLVLGDQLANGEGYSYPGSAGGVTAYYPPGFPLFVGGLLGLLRLLPGDLTVFGVAIAANVVVSVATIPLVFALARRLSDARVALVAAGVWALWPNLVFHSGIVLTETLFLFLLVLMLLVLLPTPELARYPGVWRLVATGALFGLSALVRPVSLVIAPLFLVLWWPAGVGRALRNLAVVGVATVAVIVPWTIRNAITMDSPILLSANLGDNLCIGNNPQANGAFSLDPAHPCFAGIEPAPRPEIEVRRQSETLDRAFTFIRENPGDFVGLVPDRARFTLREDHDGLDVAGDFGTDPLFDRDTENLLGRIADDYYYAVGALAVVGLGVGVAVGLARDRRWLLLVLTAPVQLVSPLVTFGDPRFKMPIYPTLALLAAVALVGVWRLRRRNGQDEDRDEEGGRTGASRPVPPEVAETVAVS